VAKESTVRYVIEETTEKRPLLPNFCIRLSILHEVER